jgi:histidinol-phosphate aminotransferase
MKIYEKVIRPEVKQLRRIKDTFDERYDYLRLDKNERLLDFQEGLLEQFRQSIKSEDLSGYPELDSLYRKLAGYLGVAENQILLTTGSDLAVKSVYEACVERGDNVVLHAPSYAMYRVYAHMFGAEPRLAPLKEDWTIDLEKMLELVDSRTKLLALENPNGFVGIKPTVAQIEACASELSKRNVLLLIDEAYHYIENNHFQSKTLIDRFPNVVISQTFSKGHGLAGVRMGYLIGDAELMEYISRVRPMHEVTSLTACAAHWVLDHLEMLAEYQKSIQESKAYLEEGLGKLGIPYRDTHANFVLLFLPNEGRTYDIAAKLKEKMILIRRPFEESFLKGWTRVCVGSVSDSQRLVQALSEVLN